MSNTGDPLTLFGAALHALNAGDWAAVAQLCDSASLKSFHRGRLEEFASRPSRMTADELMRQVPDMPREAAEYHVARQQQMMDPEQRLKEEMPDVPNVDAFRAMAPEEVFTRWLDARSPGRQMERIGAAARIPPDVAAALVAEHRGAELSLVALGFIVDGDRIAHVLYREAFDESRGRGSEEWLARLPADERELIRDMAGRGHPTTATCRRQPDGTWRLIVDHHFFGVGSSRIIDVQVEKPPQ